ELERARVGRLFDDARDAEAERRAALRGDGLGLGHRSVRSFARLQSNIDAPRRGHRRAAGAGPRPQRGASLGRMARGIVKRAIVPRGELSRRCTSPPWRWTMVRTIASPSPVPPSFVVTKGLKASSSVEGMPGPSSTT